MKYYIETYGCQMNVADTELIICILNDAGYKYVQDIDAADILLFNTCSVREHAEQRVLGRISNERHRKKSKPELKIVLLGCMAQRIGERLIREDLGIDYAVGVDQYKALPRLLEQNQGCLLDFDTNENYQHLLPVHQGEHCAFVTIMRGCNNYCSYCIVPYVRGRERSRPYEDILQDLQSAVKRNMKDVTLLGQNVNSYHWKDLSFPALLKRLQEDVPELYRLRFVTSHPKDLSDDLVQVMGDGGKLCEHIHLPMQSGSNASLIRMNRSYTYEQYLNRVKALRAASKDIAITTDLIAGFPGETQEHFEATLSAMREIEFDYAFCFKYSEREGTAAAKYQDQLPEELRLSRLQTMIELQREITLNKFRAQIGKEVEVYVESFSKKSMRQVSGKTRDFKIAVLDGDRSQIGTLVRAKVIAATAGTLICE
ncbi:MAG: tRNA (N6-isopentenyl adenosine(37)-C2)-methylthiotransferase MiaB [Candidatus Cloacimonadaceae bacterium]|nr:tRNA (N6-isopentenyl adenosine(37)-C2)-methylthiotransferase MiaB [Candidatus Cloacimonadota bacterium]MDY0126838.1 tRNA (N6-isopentenyl adenosine(37)-C2)-methylthiotransferase MiaB [Candidatus Cloacimonadaceae bacterium]MCB5255080.1 tRNA (N6-isopentenyl adenosine(37)-C2)-methylthiotransferase MiaB [Candidatus Cloacimonadota bacterium]MCK9177613.1 tRNA (N6-isopentenyl adenosine(37)-C2)-methylthiotransferase MiaB [Candidatus Cloacimonadota bacterium]MCK9241633.1 tRNA (N6-isopentenyl adenosine